MSSNAMSSGCRGNFFHFRRSSDGGELFENPARQFCYIMRSLVHVIQVYTQIRLTSTLRIGKTLLNERNYLV